MARDTTRQRSPAPRAPAGRPSAGRPSGRFLLRLDPALHQALKAAARHAGLSLNDYCARKLAAPLDVTRVAGQAHALVHRAMALYGQALVGVVVFGSWARGEAAAASDVDVLVVLDGSVPLKRALYAPWDEEPLLWDARRVEVHLVNLPDTGDAPSGVWGEVALDGLVIHEQGHRVSAHLATLRRAIADGRLVRRAVGGVPYWTREA